jgi:hypothetical protein
MKLSHHKETFEYLLDDSMTTVTHQHKRKKDESPLKRSPSSTSKTVWRILLKAFRFFFFLLQ